MINSGSDDLAQARQLGMQVRRRPRPPPRHLPAFLPSHPNAGSHPPTHRRRRAPHACLSHPACLSLPACLLPRSSAR
jgi:hypothetical protein